MGHRTDTRGTSIDELNVYLSGTGGTTTFPHQDMRFIARSGNTTTALFCPKVADLPVGLRFTIDNSLGSGDFSLTASTGLVVGVQAGDMVEYTISANHTLYEKVIEEV